MHSLSPFLSPTCARTRPPRSRARTREPASHCSAQEPLTVPVLLPVIAAWRFCRSAGCLRRGHLPPPATAPVPAEQSNPRFSPLHFCDVCRIFFVVVVVVQHYASLDWENPVEPGVWVPTWGSMARFFWKVALRQGAWAQTSKAFYRRDSF